METAITEPDSSMECARKEFKRETNALLIIFFSGNICLVAAANIDAAIVHLHRELSFRTWLCTVTKIVQDDAEWSENAEWLVRVVVLSSRFNIRNPKSCSRELSAYLNHCKIYSWIFTTHKRHEKKTQKFHFMSNAERRLKPNTKQLSNVESFIVLSRKAFRARSLKAINYFIVITFWTFAMNNILIFPCWTSFQLCV